MIRELLPSSLAASLVKVQTKIYHDDTTLELAYTHIFMLKKVKILIRKVK